jgi:hypothetical protein
MNRSRYAKGDIVRRIKKAVCLFKKLFIHINDTIYLYINDTIYLYLNDTICLYI